jgi:hypothetical protein
MKTNSLILFRTLACLLAVPAWAQVNYAVSGGSAYVTSSPNASGNVVIASTYNGYPVASIGFAAFGGCTNLTSVRIPNSVTTIEEAAFSYCTSLTNFSVDAANSVYSDLDGVLFTKAQKRLIQFPGGRGGSYAIPNSVTTIGHEALSYCTSLTSVTIGISVTTIEDAAFSYCTSLTSVAIPNSVTSIWTQVFLNCTSLTNVTIPDSVTSIGSSAFYYCTNLTGVTIGSSVTSIGNFAFYYCTSLTSVAIGSSVTGIGFDAFSYCTSLTSVAIPNSVTTIEDAAFSYCTNLAGVYFQGNVPTLGGDVFSGADNATVYYLPGTTGWGTTFAGRPTALWKPRVLTGDASFGVRTNQFGFNITWASGKVVVVEASPNPAKPTWIPVGTNTLTGGSAYFSDPEWTNYPARFYRLRSP